MNRRVDSNILWLLYLKKAPNKISPFLEKKKGTCAGQDQFSHTIKVQDSKGWNGWFSVLWTDDSNILWLLYLKKKSAEQNFYFSWKKERNLCRTGPILTNNYSSRFDRVKFSAAFCSLKLRWVNAVSLNFWTTSSCRWVNVKPFPNLLSSPVFLTDRCPHNECPPLVHFSIGRGYRFNFLRKCSARFIWWL